MGLIAQGSCVRGAGVALGRGTSAQFPTLAPPQVPLLWALDVRTGPSDSVSISPRHSCKASPVLLRDYTRKLTTANATANRGQPRHRGRGRRSQQMWHPRLCRPCPEPIQQGACQDPGAKSCATEYAGERMLPERDALCDLHGACRTDAAGSQAQQGQLAAQPSTTRTMPRAASVELPRPRRWSAEKHRPLLEPHVGRRGKERARCRLT